MKIKTIHISNYRKISDAKINIDDNITVIAGANNSGKTSIVELLNHVFGYPKSKLYVNDFPATECQTWSRLIYPKISEIFETPQSKEERMNKICELIIPTNDSATPISMRPIEVKIQVDYNKISDDIRLFADYIMDFDANNSSFYFIYKCELSLSQLRKNLDNEYNKILSRFEKIKEPNSSRDADEINDLARIVTEMLVSIYANSSIDAVYFSDGKYENQIEMEISSFKELFNFGNIMAGRKLDDENSDRTQVLSKQMIDNASQEDSWNDLINTLPDQIIQPIQNTGIRESIQTTSLDALSDTMDSISKTNGTHSGKMVIDMNITEDNVKSLLKNITCAKYQVDEYYLSESSQGLGYSNLIYIHLQLEKFKRTMEYIEEKPIKVNFFIIEEPEAHMHPQMQNAFANYLSEYYNDEINLQGLLTTHSHEIVRTTNDISKLRVLRQISPFECECFDLQEFRKSINDKINDKKKKVENDDDEKKKVENDDDRKELKKLEELLDFYDFFYTVNFPDIIFADKVVMYEGDTERMYIKRLLEMDDFKSLKNQYLSYVQVGGAYAHNYEPIINFLKIKTVIITDIDYAKDATSLEDVLKSNTTNSTINHFAKKSLDNETPTIQDLYNWKSVDSPIIIDDLIYLAYQGEKDHSSRTLEEAMLANHYSITVFDTKTQDEWKEKRKIDGLKYSVPNKSDSNLRDIVKSTSNKKTDFMYSVIINKFVESMCPDYIKGALLWLSE